MVGSSQSIAGPITFINTIVADALSAFADELENSEDFQSSLNRLIKRTIKEHKRILFNGNNYSSEWVAEAKRRGLYNLSSTPEALPHFSDEKNIRLFEKHGIYNASEITSRVEILQDNYVKTVNIEALTLMEMLRRDILPAISAYCGAISDSALSQRSLCPDIDTTPAVSTLSTLSAINRRLFDLASKLEEHLCIEKTIADINERAFYVRNNIFYDMEEIRANTDSAEVLIGSSFWPYPTYGEMMNSI